MAKLLASFSLETRRTDVGRTHARHVNPSSLLLVMNMTLYFPVLLCM